VKKQLEDADASHGFNHVECVVNLSRKIGKAEGADLRILIPAAYLHDIVPRNLAKDFNSHTIESARKVEEILSLLKFSKNEIERIKLAIISSSFYFFEKGILPKTLEAKVLRDADWLDAIGARGIARVFYTCGYYQTKEMGKVDIDPQNPKKLSRSQSGIDQSPIYHFFSKLLWLKNNMNTRMGGAIAEERHDYMVDFLKKFKKESYIDTD
jgi:uncharacterized protein